MAVMIFDDKNEPDMPKNLKKVGAADDLNMEQRVQVLQQQLAELLTALQKAGIRTDL